MEPRGKKVFINIYICGATGAIIGWFFAGVMGKTLLSERLEAVAIGIFGAVGAGEILADVFSGAKPNPDFTVPKLMMAVGGAAVMLFLLTLMRKIVGPMQQGKSKIRNR